MKCNVDNKLVILRALYFFQLSSISTLFIYLTPFISEWGINATEMAVLNFVANILGFFARPFIGFLADKYMKYKELIILIAALCGLFYSIHLASPRRIRPILYSLNAKYTVNVSSNSNLLTIYIPVTMVNACWPLNLSQCQFSRMNDFSLSLDQVRPHIVQYLYATINFTSLITSSSLSCRSVSGNCNDSMALSFQKSFHDEGFTWSSTFWILGMIKVLGYLSFQPLVSLTDAVTFITIGYAGTKKFGLIRMFGSIGILVYSFVVAGILELVNYLNVNVGWLWIKRMLRFSQFTPCFVVALINFMIIIIIASFLKVPYSLEEKKVRKKQSPVNRFLELTSADVIIRSWENAIFFFFSILGGFFYILFSEYFFFIIFSRYSQLPKYFPGLITFVMTVSESTAFGVTSHLLKLKSYEFWVSISFLAWTVRWFSYLFIENFWFLLLTEILSGPAFGLMLTCMISHASTLAIATTQGRVQGLFSGIFFNIGGALGGLVGGVILDNLGMFGLFKVMGSMSAICCLYWPLQMFVIYHQKKSQKKDTIAVLGIDEDIQSNGTQALLSDNKV